MLNNTRKRNNDMIIYEDLHRPPMFLPLFEESGTAVQNRFRSRNAMFLAREAGFLLPPALFYKRLKLQSGDRKIIVFDSGASPEYLNRLCRKYPDRRVILFFWNPVTRYRFDALNPKVELWTYSEKDSREYKLKLNTQFYFDVLADETENCPPPDSKAHPKVLFVGREKGRAEALSALQERLLTAGAEVEQHLVYRPSHFRGPAHLTEKTVPYRAVVELIKRADIILDYSTDPEAGLSLRAMEALFWRKKLITNNTGILKADFYHPNNIFVLGKESRSLEEFFRCAPQPVEKTVRDRYRLSNWLKRFDEEA